MRLRILLFIGLAVLLVNSCIVAGAQSDETEWLDAQEYTLYWGDEINHSGYLITASDFSPAKPTDDENDYVMLTISSIYHDSWGAILANNTGISNNTVFDERLNITAIEIITGNDIPVPYATLSVAIANSTGSLPVKIKWMDATFEFEERISNEVYIDERAYFSLKIKNLKEIPLESVSISKFIPQEFVFDPDSEIQWNLSFDPYETKTLEYSLKALKPGTYEFNGSLITVEYNGRIYSKELNTSDLTIHGPFLNISKSVSTDSVGLHDQINITLNVANEGDRSVRLAVSDQLPIGAVLISGDTGVNSVLHSDSSISLSYSVRMDKAGDIIIPAGQAKFVDSKEYEGIVYSEKQLIHVLDPDETIYAESYDDSAYFDETSYDGEYQDIGDISETVADVAEEEEDHGKLQFLYDILGSITGFLKNTKDKIL
ncbi:hypothetical protein RE476_02575 [Methanolobus mangrovi]|uniref:DUF11 domain-containing protein n=1 Tax=Methanolobus mangrovi TaxID=3072977 RepID=A0AA51UGB2_9EURY|nr:hypothetical protein [Methanolobus mangrovi]WMW22724.1 hypothetical protein RE476_02575 [Methanolobus mangrovi]